MFTVKFCSYFSDGSSYEQSISCPNYSVYSHGGGSYTITTFTNHMDTVGVDRKVISDENAKSLDFDCAYFHCVYVENSAGKTISKISPDKDGLSNLSG